MRATTDCLSQIETVGQLGADLGERAATGFGELNQMVDRFAGFRLKRVL